MLLMSLSQHRRIKGTISRAEVIRAVGDFDTPEITRGRLIIYKRH